MQQRRISLLLLLLALDQVQSFHSIVRPARTHSTTALPAKKKASRFATSSSGAGFGTAASSTPKTRSLAGGQAGSGTKPLRKAANLFDSLRQQFGVAQCRDVYVRAPVNSPTTFWFVGKIAMAEGVEADAAAIAQKRLIFEYSKRELRPQNLGGRYAADLELWLAPGDSEMDVVRNKVALERVTGSLGDLPDDFDLDAVGYNPEIYVGDERVQGGLRVERDTEGRPVKPVFDVNESA